MLTTILFLSLQAATAKPVDARECLPLREIKSQQAIDDSNIVFTLRNGKSYKNTLDAQCWGSLKIDSQSRVRQARCARWTRSGSFRESISPIIFVHPVAPAL
jgi:hypothetical protein